VAGVIDEDTLVWGQGLMDWLPIRNVRTLVPQIRTREGEKACSGTCGVGIRMAPGWRRAARRKRRKRAPAFANPLPIHPHLSSLSPSSSLPAPVHPVQFATWLKRKLVIEPALAAVRKQRAEHRPDTSLGQEKWMQ